jgi:hypothetical protein
MIGVRIKMARPIKDCQCEDFPCCEHADNFETEPEYCDICGYNYYGPICKFCEAPYEEEEDEDE